MGDASIISGETPTVTVVLSEAVTAFTKDDIACASGSLGTIAVGGDGVTWTGTFTPTASTTAAGQTCVVGTTWTDSAGNAPEAGGTSSAYAVDTAAPTSSWTSISDNSLIEGETSTLIMVLSEANSGFTNDDVVCANGAVAALSVANDGVTYTGEFTPTADTTAASNT